ncbi:DUF308 domain-containing protein [Rugosimonospora africana]|uniref:Uncharacterized protein n=1 Tax=Rugosimonospora africana TaxID=556532 RepID=A0A8J3VPP3_9ACTN|nr:DUF308 domain-containing protein [Rugosimonospora africana]GIH13631.1 hypothetical protein Raf01_18030 [Rugosimonospora africana]
MDAPRNYQDESEGRWYPGYSERYPTQESRFDDEERYRVPEPRYSDLGETGGDPGRFRDGYSPEAEAYSSSAARTDSGLTARNTSPMGPRSGVELPPLPSQAEPADSRFHSDATEPRFPADQPDPRFHSDPGESRFHSEQSDSRFHTEPIDRAALRRAPGSVGAPTQLAPPVSGPPPIAPPPMAPPPVAPPMQAGPPPSMQPASQGPGGMPAVGGAPDAGGAIYRTRHTGAAILLVIVAIVAELLTLRMLFTGEFGHPFQPGEVLAGIFTMAGIPLVAMGLYGAITGAASAGGPSLARAWSRPPLALLPVGLVLILAGALAI